MILLKLSWLSMKNRTLSSILTVFSIAISVALFISVNRIRIGAKESFVRTIAGTDLIVGARTSPIQLLLNSVFHIGNPDNNVKWASFEEIAQLPEVQWQVPLSLGDSHHGYRVVGSTEAIFDHLKYGADRPLSFSQGQRFHGLMDAVVGYRVAEHLGYQLGQKIVLSHGLDNALHKHDDQPFTIVGILEKTNTPIDQSVLVSLSGIEAIHKDWHHGLPPKPHAHEHEHEHEHEATSEKASGFRRAEPQPATDLSIRSRHATTLGPPQAVNALL